MDNDVMDAFLAGAVIQLMLLAKQNEHKVSRWRKSQQDGIDAARTRGVRFGRPRIKPPKNFEALVARWEQGTLPFQELLARTGLKEATFYRRLRELRKCRPSNDPQSSPDEMGVSGAGF